VDGEGALTDYEWSPVGIDTSRPHPARLYDYYLGGKDNYPVDRAAAEEVLEAAPEVRLMARENRAFLQRVVRFLVGEAGVRQIIDIGTGIPTAGNVHEVAREIAPDTRVVYIDNDPIVRAHANALPIESNFTRAVLADLRAPEMIVDHPKVRELIDFTRPVALLLIAVLHFVTDEENPYGIVKTLLDALPAGSFLAISHVTNDFRRQSASQVAAVYDRATSTVTLRGKEAIATLFDGCELIDPGLVRVPLWRNRRPLGDELDSIWLYGGLGRKSVT
jgi:trans-aconitate methyltransferase